MGRFVLGFWRVLVCRAKVGRGLGRSAVSEGVPWLGNEPSVSVLVLGLIFHTSLEDSHPSLLSPPSSLVLSLLFPALPCCLMLCSSKFSSVAPLHSFILYLSPSHQTHTSHSIVSLPHISPLSCNGLPCSKCIPHDLTLYTYLPSAYIVIARGIIRSLLFRYLDYLPLSLSSPSSLTSSSTRVFGS